MKSIESYWDWDSEALSMIADLRKTPQSKKHHAEGDVYVHTQMVLSEVEKAYERFSDRTKTNLLLTACLHDIAKPMTTVWKDGDWRSPKHSKLGEKISREILWNSIDYCNREEIASMIKYHGLPIWFQDKRNPEMSVIEASLRCSNEELALFAECDFRGRICDDLDESLFKIELYREKAQELDCFNSPYKFTSDWARLHYFRNGGYPGKEIWEPEGGWVTIMCGLPGSGKNTWIENNYDGPIIELDAIRKKHKIKWGDKDAQGYVFQEAKEELKAKLRKKQDVLWNGTNMTELQRKIIRDTALDYNSKVRIVYVDCSVEQALDQNRKREEDKRVKDSVIEKYSQKMELPNLTECHELIVI